MADILLIIISASIGILFSFLRELHFQEFIYLNTNCDNKSKLTRIRGNNQKELYLHLIRGTFTDVKKELDGNKLIITFYMSNLSERIYRLQTPFGAPIYYFHNENVWIRGRRLSSVKYLDKALLSIDGNIFKRKRESKIENMFHY